MTTSARTAAFVRRLWAMVVKETIQMRRDRLTFATMLAVPLMQLVLFGYAINTDPRHLPTAVLVQDTGPLTRSVLSAFENTSYFDLVEQVRDPSRLESLVQRGRVQFAIEIPADFEHDVLKGRRPALLVISDATDPAATGGAVAALEQIADVALRHDLDGPTATLRGEPPPFEVRIHRRYNPAGETRLNIVPGLLGVILTLTMTLFTALAVTREIERGTMEKLLAMPIRPVEIMLGKILPFVAVGATQMALILIAARLLFDVPVEGSLALLVTLTTLFIVANLAVGYTFSTLAGSQLQAVQMTFLFFLPNLLLSGFMFPFRGMPEWAQWIGEVLPLTHFLRIVRGIMLKGSGLEAMTFEIAALAIFVLVAMGLALARFRQTID